MPVMPGLKYHDFFQQNVLIFQVFGKALPFFVGLKVSVVLDPKAMFRPDARQRLDGLMILMVKLGNFCKEYRIWNEKSFIQTCDS